MITPNPTEAGTDADKSARRLAALLKSQEAVEAGYGGVLPNGNIVDRRERPEAVPMQKNPSLGIPEPKSIDAEIHEAFSIGEEKLRSIGDRVIVERLQRPEKLTAAGIVVPEIARTKYARGTVLAVGEKVTLVKVGDVVMLPRLADCDKDCVWRGRSLCFVHEDDLIAKWEEGVVE